MVTVCPHHDETILTHRLALDNRAGRFLSERNRPECAFHRYICSDSKVSPICRLPICLQLRDWWSWLVRMGTGNPPFLMHSDGIKPYMALVDLERSHITLEGISRTDGPTMREIW